MKHKMEEFLKERKELIMKELELDRWYKISEIRHIIGVGGSNINKLGVVQLCNGFVKFIEW